MILPTKNVPTDQALVTVGAQVLMQLDRPSTISSVWERLCAWRTENSMPSYVPFWWFALALDFLYTIGTIELTDGTLRRRDAT
jgi:hypothetical protein